MQPLEIGIYDDLDHQTQPLLSVDLLSSNVIVFGDHMSGKTTLLKTMMVRMHQNASEHDREELFVIDFGGNLAEYGQLPFVAACFDNSNEEDIRRVFKTVDNRLQANYKALRARQFLEVYKKAEGERPRHITLMIDNVNSFLADERYASYQEDLLRFCRDGLSKGLSVMFTANDTSNGLGKFLSNFGWKFVYDVATEVYIDVFGSRVNEPFKTNGRGMTIIGGKPREFQTFLPFEDEEEELKALAAACSERLVAADKLNAFGDELTVENYAEYAAEGVTVEDLVNDENRIAIGLDYYDHTPVVVDLHDMHVMAIYGKKRFGKTNLLRLLLRSVRARHPEFQIVLVDDGRRQLQSFHKEDDPSCVYMDKLETLSNYLEENGYAAKGGRRDAFQEKDTPVTVFVLQNKMLFQGAGKQLLKTFSDMAAKAEEKGYYMIYSDVRKVGSGDREAEAYLNNSVSAAFLLDNIAEFITDKGSRSVFGEMDPKELKTEYARCELGDGYFYDIESDALKKMRFIKA